jgi:hypothetical protein
MSTSYSSDQERVYQQSRAKYFKGTIVVSVIYGTIALVMFILTVFSQDGKTIITQTMLPFTIAFIGGMTFVVVILLIALFTSKPPPIAMFEYDKIKCPDYWKLEKTEESVLNTINSNDRFRMKYRCVRDTNILPQVVSSTPMVNVSAPSTDATLNTLLDLGTTMYGQNISTDSATGAKSADINCNMLYPDYMNYHDTKNDASKPNKIRCEYAKKCKTPWTAVCPNYTLT